MSTIFLHKIRLAFSTLIVGSLIGLNACQLQDHPLPGGSGPDQTIYLLTTGNRLVKRNLQMPDRDMDVNAITGEGLDASNEIASIDFRPATGQLYGLTNSGFLYVINPESGAARRINATALFSGIGEVEIDFNPTVDLLRVVSTNGTNLRVNPNNGTITGTDGTINGAITAVAYTNNRAGAATTTLYDLNIAQDKLFIQNPPNNGTLVEVGGLGMDVTAGKGFDISPDNSLALLAVTVGGRSELHNVNLSTGAITKRGDLGSAYTFTGLAIPTEAVAYAVDASNNLIIFNPMALTPVSKAITGLQTGETILGIDMRPANGQIYALGSTSRIYTINASSGAATAVGAGPFTPALSGTEFGFDFNPAVDLIRIVSNTGQNLRVNPTTGALAGTDGNLNPGSPAVTAAGYSQNFPGTTATTLFVIDSNTDKLYRQMPPNNGTLVEVGGLGIDIDASNGFDVTGATDTAYGLFSVGGTTRIYRLNLGTGAATQIATFPTAVKGMTVGLGF
ncbi:DUF4394 domain-containing protein [Tellurirhabdus rosea]|uniref:DUF4394 domain-containing protein n=1 Tax=Tellurirhabdus rosea TaxID=2674997 RepID=UPI002255A3EC|nr:DUF4394 domain-containing protein [Tellurirhabdus rosea]